MNPEQQKSIPTIALLAAFADGDKVPEAEPDRSILNDAIFSAQVMAMVRGA